MTVIIFLQVLTCFNLFSKFLLHYEKQYWLSKDKPIKALRGLYGQIQKTNFPLFLAHLYCFHLYLFGRHINMIHYSFTLRPNHNLFWITSWKFQNQTPDRKYKALDFILVQVITISILLLINCSQLFSKVYNFGVENFFWAYEHISLFILPNIWKNRLKNKMKRSHPRGNRAFTDSHAKRKEQSNQLVQLANGLF